MTKPSKATRRKKQPANIASVFVELNYVAKDVGDPVGLRAKRVEKCPICNRSGWRKSEKQMVHRTQIVLTDRNESKLVVTSRCSLSLKNIEKAAAKRAKSEQEAAQ